MEYEIVIKHLREAYAHCGDSAKVEPYKKFILSLISSFVKLNDKNKKITEDRKSMVEKYKFKFPDETLKILDKLIEKEIENNETDDNR